MTRDEAMKQWQDRMIEVYRDRVHYDRGEMRWYFRHPETRQWRNDRMVGYRLTLLTQEVSDAGGGRAGGPDGPQGWAIRQLSDRLGQYQFLSRLAVRYWDMEEPHDFRTNRDTPARRKNPFQPRGRTNRAS